MFLLFKERRPFKLKKEHPSEQWQIISFRLIPLKTPVSFRWTVPLTMTYTQCNAKCLSIRCRVANLGDFSPKNANLGIFLAFGELGDFLGNFESQIEQSIFRKILQNYEDFIIPTLVPPDF
jgi:hypothetical protein